MAASYGEVLLRFSGGVTLAKDVYLDDAAGNFVRWDNGAGAGAASSTEFVMPADGMVEDVCIVSATAQTKTSVQRDGTPTGDMLRNSVHLSTVAFRPKMGIPFKARQKVTMTQLA